MFMEQQIITKEWFIETEREENYILELSCRNLHEFTKLLLW